MSALQRRILRDYKKVISEGSKNFTVKFQETDIKNWDIVLFGPPETIWEGGVFRMKIIFPDSYPQEVPEVKFIDIPFHPNVYQNGSICLDLLQHNWVSAYDTLAILTSIQSLLVAPNPHSPANNEAAVLFTDNISEYNRRVRSCVEATWNNNL